MDLFTDMG